jgi:hypothetical protein
MRAASLALLLLAVPAQAGLYYSGERIAELPSKWAGFLPDQRTLRTLGNPGQANPLRSYYVADRDRLTKLARERPLTADESADLGAVQVRLGDSARAIEVLRAAQARFPDHHHVAANLGTAWQLHGDLEQAEAALRHAVDLAPPRFREAERLQLKLVVLRRSTPKGEQRLDNLFGANPRPDAVAPLQQLALWLPADGRLLWQLAELAHSHGDARTAAAILDGCVTEFGLNTSEVRTQRRQYRAEADQKVDHSRHVAIVFRSPRPLVRSFDTSRLPPMRPDGINPLPWPLLSQTTLNRVSQPAFDKHLLNLDGKRVALTGYMQPIGDGVDTPSFLLIENPVGCWFCEAPGPNGVVLVELARDKSAMLSKEQVKVTGRLELNHNDPEAYLFILRDAAIAPPD